MKARQRLVTLLLSILAAMLIAASTAFAMYDQGDFARMVSRTVGLPLDGAGEFPAMHWRHASGIPVPNPSSGLASVVFWLAALVQRPLSDDFSLVTWGVAIKSAMAASMLVLARVLTDGHRHSAGLYLCFGAGLLMVAFAPHNSAFFQTFYPEQIALVALPGLCASLVGRFRMRALLFSASLMALAWTKPQYSYVPLLVFVILCFCRDARPMSIRKIALVCIIVQIMAVLPIARSTYVDINRYNATYFGSYLKLDATERLALPLGPAQMACIGTDWWGNRIESPTDMDAERGDANCGKTLRADADDVIAPFVRHPALLPDMMTDAVRAHWTTAYFHIDKDTPYLRVDPRREGRVTAFLRGIDSLVSILASPVAFLLLLLCISPLALHAGTHGRWTAACVFLSGFVVSQLVVSLFGEGFRDLSKHLALALFASELLAFVVLGACLSIHRNRSIGTGSSGAV